MQCSAAAAWSSIMRLVASSCTVCCYTTSLVYSESHMHACSLTGFCWHSLCIQGGSQDPKIHEQIILQEYVSQEAPEAALHECMSPPQLARCTCALAPSPHQKQNRNRTSPHGIGVVLHAAHATHGLPSTGGATCFFVGGFMLMFAMHPWMVQKR